MMYGGTCINIACIPTKLLMHDALDGREYKSAIERKNGVIGRLRDKNYHSVADLSNATVLDRKSTRLNSSHVSMSYAVFCLIKNTTISAHRTADNTPT